MRLHFAVWAGVVLACAVPGTAPPPPVQLSELAGQGDAQRRASQRLVLQGLDEQEAGRPGLALSEYERALQVDPTNPWAYLALARHAVEQGEPGRALAFLDQCESLLPEDSLRVEAHLAGLRGAALRDLGRPADAAPWLDRARALAPAAWDDGFLDARELR